MSKKEEDKDVSVAPDEDAPTTMMTKTLISSSDVDLNNLPGTVRLRLIESGELAKETSILPANMPGRVLKEIRERQNQRTDEMLTKKKERDEAFEEANAEESSNPYSAGDFVDYKGKSYEVLKVDGNKIVIEIGEETKSIRYTKVSKG